METKSSHPHHFHIKYFPINSPRSKKSHESLYDMTHNIAIVAIPAIISLAFSLLVQLINIALIGHLGDAALVAAVGLGNLYLNMFS